VPPLFSECRANASVVHTGAEAQMRLLIAWVVSALAGLVVYVIAALIVAAISTLYAWGPKLNGLLISLRSVPAIADTHAVAFFLFLQFTYGGLVYLLLRRLGLFNLPLVFLAYLAPIAGIALNIGAPAWLANAIPMLAAGTALAVVGWFLARPSTTSV
jgi:hypothetical protein